jgi:hypothetical protein
MEPLGTEKNLIQNTKNKSAKISIDFFDSICYPYAIKISRRATLASIPLGHRRNGNQAFIFLNEERG